MNLSDISNCFQIQLPLTLTKMHNKKTDTESYIISVSVLLLLFIFKSDNEDFEKYMRYRIKYPFQKNDQ